LLGAWLVPGVVLALAIAVASSSSELAASGAWLLALVAVVGSGLAHVERSEVPHLVFAVEALAHLAAGGLAAVGAHACGVPRAGVVAAFTAPAVLHHTLRWRRRERARAAAIDEPRLLALTTAQLIAEAATSPAAPAIAALVLDRADARGALLRAAGAGSPVECKGAIEVAVFGRTTAQPLSLETARAALARPGVATDERERALVAVWDGADAALIELLKRLALECPELLGPTLETRARSGDHAAIDEWLAASTLDGERTAGSMALALGDARRSRPRLEGLRARHAEGTPARARLEQLVAVLDALFQES
jgi:hypothetical protein